ncbi:Repeat domain-containing protein [Lentzea albidocapillata subsp. violacea]|uniref:Repeat domain-containing protein n=1 Tax=Lentzea albidocapillata subsp. violacea TaxID=128104 RepID=A0A1G9EJM2_9PSEU|nr:trypsin-like serine protease [Lentzea albidocapillata]SDK76278.1 Repeat domain-containing protein [Lentzea albidocapillata subsp. violacea]
MRSWPRAAAGAVVTAAVTAGLVASPSMALSGGTVVPDGSYKFLAKISKSAMAACSGVLVDPVWVLTAKGCTPDGATVSLAGRTIGIARVVEKDDRDVVLVRLKEAVGDVAPIAIGAAPAQGEVLRAGGFGRTVTEWVPDRPRTSLFTVGSSNGQTVALTGNDGVDTCKGDAGGPVFREVGGVPQLVGLNAASWQHGCLGVSETRQGSTAARVDNLGSWFASEFLDVSAVAAPRHAINLTWVARGNQSFKVYAAQTADVPIGASTLVATAITPRFTHSALAAKQRWYYRVVPVRDGQDGPASGVATATTKVPTRNDFTGDGVDDLTAAYDVGGFTLGLPVWTGGQDGLGAPEFKLTGPAGGFDLNRARFLSGDFNGDGKADTAAFYNYDGGDTKILVFYAGATGYADWQEKWTGGAGNWPAQTSKVLAGDFNADGKADIAAFYDLGNDQTKLFVWSGTATGFEAPVAKWDSGQNQWRQAKGTYLAGDYNGDGRVDVTAAYDHGDGRMALWTFEATADGFTAPVHRKEVTGWGGSQARYVSGDWNGDGRSDIGAFYNYPGGQTKLLVFYVTATSFDGWSEKWDGLPGNWPAQTARVTSGDYNGDGRADVVAFYNFDNGLTRSYMWKGTATGFDAPVQQWDGGQGNWPAQSARVL